MNILILEDDHREALDMVERLRFELPGNGHDTHIAINLAEAISEIGHNKYDAAIINFSLSYSLKPIAPNATSGVNIINMLRQSSPETKCIVYSSYPKQPIESELRASVPGADFIFEKPSVHEAIWGQMAKILGDFITPNTQSEDKPDLSRILPARQSVEAVNIRLADIFRQDPKLLRTIDPIRFEQLVAELFEEDGYRVVLTPPRSDGGKDIYVYKSDDKVKASYLVECKRYVPPNKVGVETVRQLYGVLQHERRTGGIVVTTSYFTRGATDFAETLPYQLFLHDFNDMERWLQKPRSDHAGDT